MARIGLLERQRKSIDVQNNRLAESIKNRVRIDPRELVRLMESDNFSWRTVRKNLQNNEHKLKEANSESAFGQLLRYGVQHFMFDAYQSMDDFVYSDYVSVRPSSNRQEWYAPLYGPEIPRDVPVGGKFEDSKLYGLDRELVNKKVGRMFSIERELVDDDQTGQIEDRATKLGSRMRYKEEADVNGVDVFTNVPTQRGGITGVAGVSYSVAKGNRPAAFTQLSQSSLEAADIALHTQLDPTGMRIMVKPSLLLVSPSDKFNAAKLLNSTLQPSVPGAAGQNLGTASSGLTGYVNTVNPLQGLYTLKVSRFLPANYWFLMEPRTSIVFQERDPLELLMEGRDAGMSFERDEYRWRVRRRYATDVIDYLFIYCGNGQ